MCLRQPLVVIWKVIFGCVRVELWFLWEHSLGCVRGEHQSFHGLPLTQGHGGSAFGSCEICVPCGTYVLCLIHASFVLCGCPLWTSCVVRALFYLSSVVFHVGSWFYDGDVFFVQCLVYLCHCVFSSVPASVGLPQCGLATMCGLVTVFSNMSLAKMS